MIVAHKSLHVVLAHVYATRRGRQYHWRVAEVGERNGNSRCSSSRTREGHVLSTSALRAKHGAYDDIRYARYLGPTRFKSLSCASANEILLKLYLLRNFTSGILERYIECIVSRLEALKRNGKHLQIRKHLLRRRNCRREKAFGKSGMSLKIKDKARGLYMKIILLNNKIQPCKNRLHGATDRIGEWRLKGQMNTCYSVLEKRSE